MIGEYVSRIIEAADNYVARIADNIVGGLVPAYAFANNGYGPIEQDNDRTNGFSVEDLVVNMRRRNKSSKNKSSKRRTKKLGKNYQGDRDSSGPRSKSSSGEKIGKCRKVKIKGRKTKTIPTNSSAFNSGGRKKGL